MKNVLKLMLVAFDFIGNHCNFIESQFRVLMDRFPDQASYRLRLTSVTGAGQQLDALILFLFQVFFPSRFPYKNVMLNLTQHTGRI